MTEEIYEVGLLFTELNGRCVRAPFLQLHIRGEIRTAPVRTRREQLLYNNSYYFVLRCRRQLGLYMHVLTSLHHKSTSDSTSEFEQPLRLNFLSLYKGPGQMKLMSS